MCLQSNTFYSLKPLFLSCSETRWDGSQSLLQIDFHMRDGATSIPDVNYAHYFRTTSFQLTDNVCPVQTSSPDWMLLYWQWEKSKVMASVKSNGTTNYAVHQVSETRDLRSYNGVLTVD